MNNTVEEDAFEAIKELGTRGEKSLRFNALGILVPTILCFISSSLGAFMAPVSAYLIFRGLSIGAFFLENRAELLLSSPSNVKIYPGLAYSIILLNSVITSVVVVVFLIMFLLSIDLKGTPLIVAITTTIATIGIAGAIVLRKQKLGNIVRMVIFVILNIVITFATLFLMLLAVASGMTFPSLSGIH